MANIILTTESGSDLTCELSRTYGVHIVPMHVSFGAQTKDDGSFPPEEICRYYETSGELPKTSGCSPDDFERVFDAIHSADPQAHILHLAYSAATTVSYQSAILASHGLKYITVVDTKHVSAGLTACVTAVAEHLRRNPHTSPEWAAHIARDYARRVKMCFIPDDLEYLRAGGRISNVSYYLGGRLLRLHPRVEVRDGKLVATKKYRGSMEKSVSAMIGEYAEENHLKKDHLWLLHTPRTSDSLKAAAEDAARLYGFTSVTWLSANGVITTHGGPGAIALAGVQES